MRRLAMVMLIVAGLGASVGAGLVAGCTVNVDLGNGPFRCQASGECPDGQTCDGVMCVDRSTVTPDVGATAVCGDSVCDETCDCVSDCGACVSGQLLHWPLDVLGDATALDASGAGKVGAITGAVAMASSPRAGAATFDGSGGRITRAMELDFVSADVAIAAWVRAPMLMPDRENRREVVSFGDVFGLRVLETGEARFFGRRTGDWEGATSVARVDDNQWHHLVGQNVGARLEVYIDGVLASSLDSAEGLNYEDLSGRDFVVGEHGDGGGPFFMNGEIDDVRLFNRSLDGDEIAQLAAP